MKTNTLYQRDFTGICPGHRPEKERKERKKLRGCSPLLMCMIANPVWEMVDNLCMRFERFVKASLHNGTRANCENSLCPGCSQILQQS